MNSLQQAQRIVGYGAQRAEGDFYPTPGYCTEDLLRVERFEGSIWEPACGDGAISKVLEQHGYRVLSTDLVYRGYGMGGHDFFMESHGVDNIITNPPYRLATEFVERAVLMAKCKVAMFLKLAFLEGQERKLLFERTPLARVYVYSKRVNLFAKPTGSGMIAFAWFVWDKSYTGEPVIRWL